MKLQIAPIRSEKGQSLTEFGLGMIILLILLAGIVDAGRALFTYMALREAAQEGALYGSTDPTNSAEIVARVENASDTLENLSNDAGASMSTQVTILGSPCSGHGIRVRVSYANFPIAMPFLGAVIGSQTVPLSASATDTILTPSCH
jgi:Flp pilus assembly protein TadG